MIHFACHYKYEFDWICLQFSWHKPPRRNRPVPMFSTFKGIPAKNPLLLPRLCLHFYPDRPLVRHVAPRLSSKCEPLISAIDAGTCRYQETLAQKSDALPRLRELTYHCPGTKIKEPHSRLAHSLQSRGCPSCTSRTPGTCLPVCAPLLLTPPPLLDPALAPTVHQVDVSR